MSLPPNYKQVAASQASSSNVPSSSGGHYHRHSSGGVPFNILKERLRASGSGSDRGKDHHGNPFVHTSHGNPAFTPQKLTGKSSANADTGRGPKAPKAPEKPLTPYMRYSRKVWDSVKVNYPEHKLWELHKVIGQMWRDLDESVRQAFVDEHELETIEYEKAMKTYHSSPAYLSFLAWKSKVKSSDNDSHDTPSRPPKGSQQDRRIDIQPAEDEDDQDDGYSVKHVAYARFLRNHRLINEIFSDMAVPDVRTVVTTGRMLVLKRQVHSLTMHQMKLEAELLHMEEKFESKKRKLIESSEVFQDELKKHCKPAVDEEKFQMMVDRQYELIVKAERMRQLEEPNVANVAKQNPPPTVAAVPAVQRTDEAEPLASGSGAPAANASAASGTSVAEQSSGIGEQEPMETDALAEPESVKAVEMTESSTSSSTSAVANSPIESDSNSNSNPTTLTATPKAAADAGEAITTTAGVADPQSTTGANEKEVASAVVSPAGGLAGTQQVSAKPAGGASFAHAIQGGAAAANVPPAVSSAASHQQLQQLQQQQHQLQQQQPPSLQQHQPIGHPAVVPGSVVGQPQMPPQLQQQQQHGPIAPGMPPHGGVHPIAAGMPPHADASNAPPPNVTAPAPGAQGPLPPPPHQQQQQQQQHHPQGPPPHHNMPPHMAPHQAMPGGHPGMAGHPPYGPFAGAAGPPRSPYYPPQYAGHPAQPPYHQYAAYPYHQQYGPPPPSHYMGQRPPMHYGGGAEHQQQQPLPPQPHSMEAVGAVGGPPPPPHGSGVPPVVVGTYGQPQQQQQGPPMAQQQPMPPTAAGVPQQQPPTSIGGGPIGPEHGATPGTGAEDCKK